MKKILSIFDAVPLPFFAIAAIFMSLAPFVPTPHLLEKIRMLMDGTLAKPMDIFDLFWHSLFPMLLAIKILVMFNRKKTEKEH